MPKKHAHQHTFQTQLQSPAPTYKETVRAREDLSHIHLAPVLPCAVYHNDDNDADDDDDDDEHELLLVIIIIVGNVTTAFTIS